MFLLNYLKLTIYIFILKVLYNFLYWLYGYFLRYKWVSYFNTNNKNLMGYNFQIIEYLNKIPYESIIDDVYDISDRKYIEELFIKSHGYYKYLFLQNFNPFYWINIVIFFPQKIVNYLGLRFKRKTIHFLNIFYWIFSVTFAIYNDEITTFIKNLIKLIFKYFTKE